MDQISVLMNYQILQRPKLREVRTKGGVVIYIISQKLDLIIIIYFNLTNSNTVQEQLK